MPTKHPLKALNTSRIDIDGARHHFDLPIEDQFSSKAQLNQGLKATKEQLLDVLGDDDSITVFRGMTVEADFVGTLESGLPVGKCWAWASEGALKGSGLDRRDPGGDMIGIILVAKTSPENVNWEFTVAVNTFHEDEQEIVMLEDADLSLQKVLLVKNGFISRDLLGDHERNLTITSGEQVERKARLRP